MPAIRGTRSPRHRLSNHQRLLIRCIYPNDYASLSIRHLLSPVDQTASRELTGSAGLRTRPLSFNPSEVVLLSTSNGCTARGAWWPSRWSTLCTIQARLARYVGVQANCPLSANQPQVNLQLARYGPLQCDSQRSIWLIIYP